MTCVTHDVKCDAFLGMLHPQTKEPLLPQLNASLPVPLLAIAGECDMQFTPSAVARTARHLAALDGEQLVKLLVAGSDSGLRACMHPHTCIHDTVICNGQACGPCSARDSRDCCLRHLLRPLRHAHGRQRHP